MYRESKIDEQLRNSMLIDGTQYYLYSDQAYVLRPWMQVAFSRPTASAYHDAFNKSMNKVRTSVEISYGEVKLYFASQDFHRKLVISKAPYAMSYVLSVLLRNFKTCLGHGGINPEYFQCAPPSFDRYIRTE